MTTTDLIVYGGAAVGVVAGLLAYAIRPPRRRVETGAVIGWSPRQEQADSSGDQLTPTGLLETEPPATLDDGTVCGARGLPSWEALSTDTHHALDLRWEIMLREFRHNMDAIIAELGKPVVVSAR